jgi:hypothetical protein
VYIKKLFISLAEGMAIMDKFCQNARNSILMSKNGFILNVFPDKEQKQKLLFLKNKYIFGVVVIHYKI